MLSSHVDLCSNKSVRRAENDVASFHLDGSAEALHGFNMKVDRSVPYDAATG